MSAILATAIPTSWFIGHAFGFKNVSLGFDLFGSPHEILQQLRQRGISPQSAAQHVETEIAAQKVLKDPGQLRFSGGDDAPAFMQLLEAMAKADIADVQRLIAETPSLLQSSIQRTGDLLGLAASDGNTELLQLFLRSGAGVDTQGTLGMTALHWASAAGQPKSAKLLLSEGADRYARSWFLLTPAELASANGHSKLVRVLNGMLRRAPDIDLSVILKRMGCAST
jgi:hypothetical protein